ncbi:hypothetical protein BGX20_004458 [Mortierella sp. AD010]|nr:hypothetical protein BGX20_004458 [Mortierella sp. AD010]
MPAPIVHHHHYHHYHHYYHYSQCQHPQSQQEMEQTTYSYTTTTHHSNTGDPENPESIAVTSTGFRVSTPFEQIWGEGKFLSEELCMHSSYSIGSESSDSPRASVRSREIPVEASFNNNITSQQRENDIDINSPPFRRAFLGRRNAVSVPIGEEYRYLPRSILALSDARHYAMSDEMEEYHRTEILSPLSSHDKPTIANDRKSYLETKSVHPLERTATELHTTFDRAEKCNDDSDYESSIDSHYFDPTSPYFGPASPYSDPTSPYFQHQSLQDSRTGLAPDTNAWNRWMAKAMQAVNQRKPQVNNDYGR